jgi:transcriptional regulator with XRE-family HTH domain
MEKETLSAVVFGKRIGDARRARGLDVAGLASELGVEPDLVVEWEAGASIPPFDTMARLAEVLGRSLDELLS